MLMKLSEAVQINPTTRLEKGKEYPFVDMQQIEIGRKIVTSNTDRVFTGSGSRFCNGDTIMARITPCLENGKMARYAAENDMYGHGSTEFIVFRGKEGITLNDYVYYLVTSPKVYKYAISQMTGTSGRQRVPADSFKDLDVDIPTLETQKEIAQILGTLDDKIELNRKMNKTLEEIAQTLYKHWFIDFEFPNAEGKPYKSSGGEMIDSEMGLIPKGWRVGKTKDIITAIGGFAFKSENMTDTGEIGVIKIKNIEKGLVNVNNVEYLSDIGEKDIDKKHVIETGDVLIAMTGANVAKVGIVPFTRKRVVLNQRVCLIREKMKNSLYYAYIVFSSNEVQQLLFSVGSAGSAQPNISTSDIESVEIILPPFETISQFGEISYGIFLVVCKNIFQNEIIANQRTDIIKSLM